MISKFRKIVFEFVDDEVVIYDGNNSKCYIKFLKRRCKHHSSEEIKPNCDCEACKPSLIRFFDHVNSGVVVSADGYPTTHMHLKKVLSYHSDGTEVVVNTTDNLISHIQESWMLQYIVLNLGPSRKPNSNLPFAYAVLRIVALAAWAWARK